MIITMCDLAGNKLEEVEVPDEVRTNEQTSLLYVCPKITAVLNYYWDSHGKLVPFKCNGQLSKSKSNANVRIDKISYTNNRGDFEDWALYINGVKETQAQIYEYRINPAGTAITFKAVIGWG